MLPGEADSIRPVERLAGGGLRAGVRVVAAGRDVVASRTAGGRRRREAEAEAEAEAAAGGWPFAESCQIGAHSLVDPAAPSGRGRRARRRVRVATFVVRRTRVPDRVVVEVAVGTEVAPTPDPEADPVRTGRERFAVERERPPGWR